MHSFLSVPSDLLHSNPPPCISPLSTAVATQNLHPPPPLLHPFWAGGHSSVHCRAARKRPSEIYYTRLWVASCSRRHRSKNKQPIHPNIPPPHLTPSISSARIMPGPALLFARNRTHTHIFSHTRVINNAPPSKKRGGDAQTHAIAPSSFLLPFPRTRRERKISSSFSRLGPIKKGGRGRGGILGLP